MEKNPNVAVEPEVPPVQELTGAVEECGTPPPFVPPLSVDELRLTGATAEAVREALRNAEAAGYLRGLADAKPQAQPSADEAEATDEAGEPPVTFPTFNRRSIWE